MTFKVIDTKQIFLILSWEGTVVVCIVEVYSSYKHGEKSGNERWYNMFYRRASVIEFIAPQNVFRNLDWQSVLVEARLIQQRNGWLAQPHCWPVTTDVLRIAENPVMLVGILFWVLSQLSVVRQTVNKRNYTGFEKQGQRLHGTFGYEWILINSYILRLIKVKEINRLYIEGHRFGDISHPRTFKTIKVERMVGWSCIMVFRIPLLDIIVLRSWLLLKPSVVLLTIQMVPSSLESWLIWKVQLAWINELWS